MNIAIIGYGYWGPNLVRNFSTASNCSVLMVVDFRLERLTELKKQYPSLITSTNLDDLFNNRAIDAVVIATPVFTHFDLAKRALESDKHVLIEKPMTNSVEQANVLIDLSIKKNKVLMVDHTFLYTNGVQRMKKMIDAGEIGKLKYFDSTRINLGLFQPDVNVLWDLAPHDLSILNYLKSEKPFSVQATGISHTNNGIENIAFLTINYQSDFIAHFNCSWTSPVKIRMMLIGGDKKMIVFNDLEPSEKIKIYDTGYQHTTDEDKNKILVDYRSGDIFIPKIENKEALSNMAADFISAITNNTTPISNFQSGLDVVRILEAAQKSIKNKGKEVII
ncbi:MAG: Gfo/Idh/MocA family oxidoreductase [Bacteroidetes bacterium]|jgi:predicted dehydrogenase|nr:Gfo/Idh/MocA family oxidoreductase [Bacteroidota bacterium]MBK9355683.1 Gfo/Idh/MocA family oxidoreductase [Bacteroidota bacterium]